MDKVVDYAFAVFLISGTVAIASVAVMMIASIAGLHG